MGKLFLFYVFEAEVVNSLHMIQKSILKTSSVSGLDIDLETEPIKRRIRSSDPIVCVLSRRILIHRILDEPFMLFQDTCHLTGFISPNFISSERSSRVIKINGREEASISPSILRRIERYRLRLGWDEFEMDRTDLVLIVKIREVRTRRNIIERKIKALCSRCRTDNRDCEKIDMSLYQVNSIVVVA